MEDRLLWKAFNFFVLDAMLWLLGFVYFLDQLHLLRALFLRMHVHLFCFLFLVLFFVIDLLQLIGVFLVAFALVCRDIDGDVHLILLQVVPGSLLSQLYHRLPRLLAFDLNLFDASSAQKTTFPSIPALLCDGKDTTLVIGLVAFPVVARA